MRRRELFTLTSGAVAAWPLAVRAQSAPRPLIGFLGSTDPAGYESQLKALHLGFRDFGYVDGQNIAFDYRWAEGRNDRLPKLVGELLDLKVDVIVTHGPPASLAAKHATSTTPIVMAAIGDPVDFGIVSSLARPGGNLTGFSFFVRELMIKRLEVLKEVKPDLHRVGVLFNLKNPVMMASVTRMITQFASMLRIAIEPVGVRHPDELRPAVASARPLIDALLVPEDALFQTHARRIAALALEQHLPAIGSQEFCHFGGLAAYGVDFPHMWRQAATFVVKILKGTKPSDLPIEQATKFELILKLSTAKVLGIEFPESLLARADEVIERGHHVRFGSFTSFPPCPLNVRLVNRPWIAGGSNS